MVSRQSDISDARAMPNHMLPWERGAGRCGHGETRQEIRDRQGSREQSCTSRGSFLTMVRHVVGRDASSWVSFPRQDATHHKLAEIRNVPCPIVRRRDVRLPPVVIVCRVEIVFIAGSWHSCGGSRTSEQTSSRYSRAAPPLGASAQRFVPTVSDRTGC